MNSPPSLIVYILATSLSGVVCLPAHRVVLSWLQHWACVGLIRHSVLHCRLHGCIETVT